MYRLPRNYYQIYRVDHKRNREQMVAEVEGLHEAEKLVEKYLRNMTASEVKDEISYYRSTLSSSVPKDVRVIAGQLIRYPVTAT